METRVIVIFGPTCSGKTALSINLALKLNTEIISADSRQVYKLLDIGTAKPAKDELKLVKHHFVNSLNLNENFNASIFSVEAQKVIERLHQREKIPIVVGGSGLYIKALVDGITVDVETDENYRQKLSDLRREKGNSFVYDELKRVDPESAAKMLPQNWKRVIRALEVYHITGKSITHFHSANETKSNLNFIQFGLLWERTALYKNIDARVDDMLNKGLVAEVESILVSGYDTKCNSLNTVGYKEIISYLQNEISFDKAVELIKRNTRHFAKRQMTWFKRDSRINWLPIKNIDEIESIADKILASIN